jgi:hypothetical protein
MLTCIKEGCVCGKLLSIQNPARTALDHFNEKACRGVRQANGQALERAQKIAYVRSYSNTLKGDKGTDEEIRLSVMDLIGDEEEEEEEEEVEGV